MSGTALRRIPLILTLTAAALGGCDCEGDINIIAPQIAVDVCKDPPREVNGEVLGGVRDCTVDFGAQPLTTRTRRELRITNPSPVDLTIFSETSFTEDSGLDFEIEQMPASVKSGQTAIGVISYRPLVESEHRGTLVLVSDAENLAEGENVVIDVFGSGFDDGLPDISVSPMVCDYGRVAVEGVAQCTLSIENLGQRDLVFDEVALVDTELAAPPEHPADQAPFSFVGRPPARDDALPPPPGDGSAPQNVFDLTLRFLPLALGNYQGKVSIKSNDPDSPELLIPLSGIGVTPPTCGVAIKSVNGAPGASSDIEPLDDVVLTAESSVPTTADGSIAQVNWTIVDQPPGSTAVLTNPTGLETGFTFADGVLGLDLAGRYRVRATVIDDLGTESVNQCEIEFEAIPNDTVLVQLSWDTSYGDMDLHLMKESSGGQFCASSGVDLSGAVADSCGGDYSCYYGNCKATSGGRPDWDDDGVAGSEGDPSLDIDDLCGFGPENINIDVAEPGAYLVGVDFFGFTGCSGSGSVGNTIRIYIYGALAAEFFRDLDSGDWWEPAIIHWVDPADGVPCVEDLSTSAEECPGY
ncbi:MAG: hypothetical protein ACO3JL_01565 [Myxococcota bacterium]